MAGYDEVIALVCNLDDRLKKEFMQQVMKISAEVDAERAKIATFFGGTINEQVLQYLGAVALVVRNLNEAHDLIGIIYSQLSDTMLNSL